MTTCGPFKTTEGGIFDATVNSICASSCFVVQASRDPPPSTPTFNVEFFWSIGVARLAYILLNIEAWGRGGAREGLSPQKFHPLSEAEGGAPKK